MQAVLLQAVAALPAVCDLRQRDGVTTVLLHAVSMNFVAGVSLPAHVI
jgi:hypothetical protein